MAVADQTDSYFVRLTRARRDIASLGIHPRVDLDYGTFRWLELSQEDYQRLSASGAEFTLESQAAEVRVGKFVFDPLAGQEPSLPGTQRSPTFGPALHLIKLAGPAQDTWLKSLETSGYRILQYYPNYTYLVWGGGTQANLVQGTGSDFIRWQGAFQPAYKLGPELDGAAGLISNVAITFYNDGDVGKVLEAIAQAGGRYLNHFPAQPDRMFMTGIFVLDASHLADVAGIEQVWAVEYSSPEPGLEDEVGAQIVAGNVSGSPAAPTPGYFDWLTTLSLDGTGITWADVDTGLNGAHPDIAGRSPVYVSYPGAPDASIDTDGHGSHTAGAIFGDPRADNGGTGITDPGGFYWGVGTAPRADMVIQNALDGSSWPPAGGWEQLSKDSVTNGAIGSNNSWYTGAQGAQGYSAAARTHDIMVRDANFDTTAIAEPIIMVFSAGNAGPDSATMTEPHEAKNLITVAASANYPRIGAGINDLADFSSRGPALDGRLLPNVAAPGWETASWNGSTKNCGNAVAGDGAGYYNYCSGTSMAAPFVSGASLLIAEWWAKAGRGVPSPAMTKALLINGATDMVGGAGVGGNIPNNNQGWGRANLGNVVASGLASAYRDQDTVLRSSGARKTYLYTVPDGTAPVKVSLVWTDAAGAVGANPALVNDLNLTVVTGGNIYRGNVFSGGWSVTGGSHDVLNNIENIYVQSPGSTLAVTVTAATLGGDGVPYDADLTDQDFALVVANADPLAPSVCRSTADLRAGGSADKVRITNQGPEDLAYAIQFVNPQGIVQGKPVAKSLATSQSAVSSVGTLMLQAGIRTLNPAHLLQVVTEARQDLTESRLQAVYNASNGSPPVMMVYTCEPASPPK